MELHLLLLTRTVILFSESGRNDQIKERGSGTVDDSTGQQPGGSAGWLVCQSRLAFFSNTMTAAALHYWLVTKGGLSSDLHASLSLQKCNCQNVFLHRLLLVGRWIWEMTNACPCGGGHERTVHESTSNDVLSTCKCLDFSKNSLWCQEERKPTTDFRLKRSKLNLQDWFKCWDHLVSIWQRITLTIFFSRCVWSLWGAMNCANIAAAAAQTVAILDPQWIIRSSSGPLVLFLFSLHLQKKKKKKERDKTRSVGLFASIGSSFCFYRFTFRPKKEVSERRERRVRPILWGPWNWRRVGDGRSQVKRVGHFDGFLFLSLFLSWQWDSIARYELSVVQVCLTDSRLFWKLFWNTAS